MRGDGFFFVIDSERVMVSLDEDLLADGPRGDCIPVAIKEYGEIRVGFCHSHIPAIRKEFGQRGHELRSESITRELPGGSVDSQVGHLVAPLVGLVLQIIQILKGP